MSDIGSLRREVREAYKKLRNWRAVGREFGITSGMAWRIAKERGYEPRDPHLRARLGLPALVSVAPCEKCGEVHVSKRCTKERAYRDLFGMPREILTKAIREREEIKYK